MNRNRIYSMLFLLITIPGFDFISVSNTFSSGLFLGIIFITAGLIPGIIFLLKAKGEEA